MATVEDLFGAISVALESTPALAHQVNGHVVFDFGEDHQWTLYLKEPNIGVKKERAAKADVTLVLSSDDFLRLARKELSAQQLFMKGRLRLKGNMGLAMKLGKVLEAAGGAPAAAGSTPSPSKPSVPTPAPAPEPAKPSVPSHKSAAVFEAIGTALAADGAALVNKTKGIFKFIIALEGGAPPVEYILDLKNGSGQLTPPGAKYSGPAPDLEIRVSDDDFVALAQGKLNAQQAFMKGKLKLKGGMALAMKLAGVLSAARAPPSARM